MAEIRFSGSYFHPKGLPTPSPARVVLYLGLWLFAELAAFGLIAHMVGFMGAILLCVLTSIIGAAMLRNVGISAAVNLQRGLINRSREDDPASKDAMLDGALAGLGSILLILPGFVTDFFGFALAAPSVRSRLAGWLQNRPDSASRRPAAPKTIELTPQEWTRLEEGRAGEARDADGSRR